MRIAWDIEATGLSAWAEDAEILCAAVVTEHGDQFVAAPPAEGQTQTILDPWFNIVALLADPANEVYGHNIVAFDVPYWETHVGPVRAKLYDTRVGWSLVDETGEGNSLALLAQQLCSITIDPAMKKSRKKLKDFPIEDVMRYCLEDTVASFRVGEEVRAQVEAKGSAALMTWLMRVGRVLINMMRRGVNVDTGAAAQTAAEFTLEIDALVERFKSQVQLPEEFNINSDHQLRELFFGAEADGGLEMPTAQKGKRLRRTAKTDAVSLDAKNIRMLQGFYPASTGVRDWLGLLTQQGELKKMRDTYLLPLAGRHMGVDRRIHTSYFLGRGYGASGKRGGTVTGRLSSADPNLQNIPRDSRVKRVIIPTWGRRMFDADYSQLELRVAAWYSGEPVMLNAFAQGWDIHTAELANQTGIDYYEIKERIAGGDKGMSERRSMIKPINFGMLYGGTAFTVIEQLEKMGLTPAHRKVQGAIDAWWNGKPVLKTWRDTVHQTAMLQQKVTTPTGRDRHLPDVLSGYAPNRNRALRQAVNFLVQSMANEVMLTSLLLLDEGIGHMADLLLTVHDSVIGEYVPSGRDSLLEETIKRVMVERTNADLVSRYGITPLPLAVDVQMNQLQWGA